MKLKRVVCIPSNGPHVSDLLSKHFGHSNYFIGIEINKNHNYKTIFSLQNKGHRNCMETVTIMKERNVTDMIVDGIGRNPYLRFLNIGMKLFKGINGTVKENIEIFSRNKLDQLINPSCGNHNSNQCNH